MDFRHVNGATGQRYIVEIMGAGSALFDFDNDGDLDLFLVQGGPLGQKRSGESHSWGGRLYRNDLADGVLSFTDITEASGLRANGYGMGTAVGDFDNDGYLDLYLTNFGDNQLWRNLGNATFEDVTRGSNTNDSGWSVPAAFFDYNGDGYLDLYVGNYLENPLDNPPSCKSLRGAADYCGPGSFQPGQDRLLRNRGDGRFEDVTAASGLNSSAPALGVLTLDLSGDGLFDIYVANDARANHLWINEGEGRFRDDALLAGLAVNSHGKPEASMGLDGGDFDGDGDMDLIITHLSEETNTLYRNQGEGYFEDASDGSGLGAPSRPFTGFGGGWFDYDNDGWLDFFVANGAIKENPEKPDSLSQPNQLFHNDGKGGFLAVDMPGQTGESARVSRGVAFGDLDNDGDTDLVVCNNNSGVQVLLNQVGRQAHWLGLNLADEKGRDVTNTDVFIYLKDGRRLLRRATREGSYCSVNDARILAGLGKNQQVEKVVVSWPGGEPESFPGLGIDRYHTLRKGNGRKIR